MSSELQQFLFKSIPIAEHLQLEVASRSERELTLKAPLAPNVNDKETAFAGSLYSAMVLSGWLFVSERLRQERIEGNVVVVSANIEYIKPVTDDFSARCRLDDDFEWDFFLTKLKKRKNYKIALDIDVTEDDIAKAKMRGEYIAWLASLKPF